jgi:RsiW-degrading membrane proteinase PrsW (M82 family)
MKLGMCLVFIPFIIIAALMAYLISYNEWRHHYPTKKEPKKLALQSAIVTFIILSVLASLFIYFITDFNK